MQLAAEGKYTLETRENLLLIDAHGPFNEITAQQFVEDMHQACHHFKGEKWGSVVTYYGNSIFTPEAEKAFIAITKYRAKHGMVANASVILESNTADIQHMQLKRVYQTANMAFHVFNNIEAAEHWVNGFLNNKIAKADCGLAQAKYYNAKLNVKFRIDTLLCCKKANSFTAELNEQWSQCQNLLHPPPKKH